MKLFSEVLFIVIECSTYTRALTSQKLYQNRPIIVSKETYYVY
jgi:hypothetical protein